MCLHDSFLIHTGEMSQRHAAKCCVVCTCCGLSAIQEFICHQDMVICFPDRRYTLVWQPEPPVRSRDCKSALLHMQDMRGRINLMHTDMPYAAFSEADPTPPREHLVYVSGAARWVQNRRRCAQAGGGRTGQGARLLQVLWDTGMHPTCLGHVRKAAAYKHLPAQPVRRALLTVCCCSVYASNRKQFSRAGM